MKKAQTMSLGATTYDLTLWKLSPIGSPLFRVLCNESPLDPINTKSVYLPQVFPIYSYILGIISMIPFPWVSFICYQVNPAIILWTNEVRVPRTPIPLFPRSVCQSPNCPTSLIIHLVLLVKETLLPWLVVGIPLSTSTHLFQRIDPEVPVS